MGTVTRDYLRAHMLAPTQCAPNMFRILGSVDAWNEKMGLNFTHHDVNWIYNLHHLKGQRYYLKTRYPEVRLISCLRDSNKGMNKDFLIILGEWHDGLPCPTREGRPGGALGLDLFLQSYHIFTLTHFVPIFFFLCWYLKFLLICAIPFFMIVFLNCFADHHVFIPNFSLVNKQSLDKILQAEVFVHKDD